ncbi:MAG TPA: hypothetical protein VIX81_12785 [Gammaproteobacteria bacterium]
MPASHRPSRLAACALLLAGGLAGAGEVAPEHAEPVREGGRFRVRR